MNSIDDALINENYAVFINEITEMFKKIDLKDESKLKSIKKLLKAVENKDYLLARDIYKYEIR
jgi:hypothetical protein